MYRHTSWTWTSWGYLLRDLWSAFTIRGVFGTLFVRDWLGQCRISSDWLLFTPDRHMEMVSDYIEETSNHNCSTDDVCRADKIETLSWLGCIPAWSRRPRTLRRTAPMLRFCMRATGPTKCWKGCDMSQFKRVPSQTGLLISVEHFNTTSAHLLLLSYVHLSKSNV